MKWRELGKAGPFAAGVLEYSSFPLQQNECTWVAETLTEWLGLLKGQRQWRSAVFLQGAALHDAAAVNRLTDHAAEWMPDLGLGVRPGRPPHLLRPEDVAKLRWNEFPHPQHETLFHLTEETSAFRAGLPAFCGSGALLGCLVDIPVETYLARQRALWLPVIQEPAFRAHPFYVPLLCAENLLQDSLDSLASMGNARVYVRESVEDGGLLVVCANPEDLAAFASHWGREMDAGRSR